jgi:hypothetical protein
MGMVDIPRGPGLNNIVIRASDNQIFSQCFGFTKEEITNFLKGDKKQIHQLMDWYNGYYMGSCRSHQSLVIYELFRERKIEVILVTNTKHGFYLYDYHSTITYEVDSNFVSFIVRRCVTLNVASSMFDCYLLHVTNMQTGS